MHTIDTVLENAVKNRLKVVSSTRSSKKKKSIRCVVALRHFTFTKSAMWELVILSAIMGGHQI